jgi:Zn ribbon nucleic-acid-binding protein
MDGETDGETRYAAAAFCVNCGVEDEVRPVVGKTVGSQPCPTCGVQALQPVAGRKWREMLKQTEVQNG